MWNLRVSPLFSALHRLHHAASTWKLQRQACHAWGPRPKRFTNISRKTLQELSPFLLFLSYFSSCPMKFKLGEMTGLRSLTNLYASPRQRPCRFIMYATVTVAERDTPAWQCTRTPLPCSRASSTEENSKSTIRFHVAICTTWRYTCMTKPLISMAWNVNHRTSVTWLQTQICHFWSHFGFWRLTQLYQLFDRCV